MQIKVIRKLNKGLRWFLSIALRIPTAHHFRVISAHKWARARTRKDILPQAKLDSEINACFLLNEQGDLYFYCIIIVYITESSLIARNFLPVKIFPSTVEKDVRTWLIITVIYRTKAVGNWSLRIVAKQCHIQTDRFYGDPDETRLLKKNITISLKLWCSV